MSPESRAVEVELTLGIPHVFSFSRLAAVNAIGRKLRWWEPFLLALDVDGSSPEHASFNSGGDNQVLGLDAEAVAPHAAVSRFAQVVCRNAGAQT